MIACIEWVEKKLDLFQIVYVINKVNDRRFGFLNDSLLLFGHHIGLLLKGLSRKITICSQGVGGSDA